MSLRFASFCAVAVWLGTIPTAVGAWPVEGLLLSTSCCARSARVVPDGAGGAIIVWQAGIEDVYAQRVTARGEIAPGWPPDGVPVCTDPAPQFVTSVAPDGYGGVVIAWEDFRSGADPAGSRIDIYAHRLLADGSLAPGWAVNGMPVARPPGDQRVPVVAPDGSGGAFFSWHDEATLDIYMHHLTASGVVAPGWPGDGVPVCTLPSRQSYPFVTPDGTGGAIVAWNDLRDGGTPVDGPFAAYAQRVLADGTVVPGWPENGLRVLDKYMVGLISDVAGGGYLAGGTLGEIQAADYYLQRFTGEGAIAPGWPEGGSPVCLAPGDRAGLRMVPDGAGGVLLAWSDERIYPDEIYLQRMRPDGSLQPGWPLDGLRVTDNSAFDDLVTPAADGRGGAFLAWDRVAAPLGKSQAFVQHVTGAPAPDPGWPVDGQAVPGEPRTGSPEVVEDGQGGAIVVWEDSTRRLRALRYVSDGPVPVLVALVSAEAGWDHVRLTWQGAAPGLAAGIERRTSDADWERLASASADGSGRIVYEDRAVTAGTRYGYRLAYGAEGDEVHTTETWVQVPLLAFALDGPEPNPVVRDLVVTFSLPGADPARLEVYDVAGRKVLAREVGALGPGRHRVDATQGAHLPAGLYTVVLTQGERRAAARVVVLR